MASFGSRTFSPSVRLRSPGCVPATRSATSAAGLRTSKACSRWPLFFFLMLPPPPRSTLFPYTTLFRSLLISLLLVAAMLEVLVGRHSPDAPHVTMWFVFPAIAVLVLPIVARRLHPLAPAAHWLLAIGISFVDWRLIPFAISIFVVGLVAALLLGNLRDPVQAGFGLAVVIAGSATVV